LTILISIIISFLCGSIPTGYLIIKKLYGIDIRTKGSGNIGSTNVKRIAGIKIAIITQIIDILKGIVPVALALGVSKILNLPIPTNIYLSIVALVVILGHDYTPFLGFNGGKGVNTTIGAFFLLAPISILSGVAVYFILRLFIKVVSIRSIGLGITIPILCIIMKLPSEIIISATMACILMIFRHKNNLIGLIAK